MKNLILPLIGLLSAASCASADILLNEINLNPSGSDDNFEFIELKSTAAGGVESCAGLTLVIINNDRRDDVGAAKNLGKIEEALDLSELSTGTNGLLMLGDGYTGSPRGGPWSGAIATETTTGDPKGLSLGNIGPNDGVTILLVRGFTGVQTVDPQGNSWPDVDVDNNSQFDWTQNPVPAGGAAAPLWTEVVDSIGTRDYNEVNNVRGTPADPYVVASASIYTAWANASGNINTLGTRDPDTFARRLDSITPNTAGEWYGAKFNDDVPQNSIVYRANRYFNFIGEVTPGRPNLQTALPPPTFIINEVGLNPPGNTDDADRYQYVEILNTNEGGSRARSLDGYWLVLVDSEDRGDGLVGEIMEQWDLSGMTTGTNGLLLLGDGFSTSNNPFQDLVAPETSLGDPASRTGTGTVQPASGWGLGDLKNNDGFTLFLIQNYKPNSVGTADIDGGNTGNPALAAALLTGGGLVKDQIGFTQLSKTAAGRTYAYTDLRGVMAPEMKQPENLSRKLGNNTVATTSPASAEAAAAWYGGEYASDNQSMTLGFASSVPSAGVTDRAASWFGGFRGAGTPGRPNLAGPIDPANPPVAGSVRISEVMIDPTNDVVTNDDVNREYIELTSTTQAMTYLDGLWILIVRMDGVDAGTITDGFPLSGYNTGQKGITIFGDNHDFSTTYPYITQEGILPPETSVYDPEVSFGGNDIPNGGFAVLLVRGIKGPVQADAAGKPIGDLDPENDGTLLAPAEYTDELLDSISSSPVNPGAAYGWIDSTTFLPHHVARHPYQYTPNSAAGWYYGQVEQTASSTPATEYTTNFAGSFKGAISPGRINHSAPSGPKTVGAVVMNEVNLNPAGRDENYEFIELLDTAGAGRSLNGYSLVVMDNTLPNTGAIRHAWSLDGFSTGANGLFMLGSRYTEAGANPFSAVISPQTQVGDPPGRDGLDSSFWDGIIGLDTDNQNLTLLLTRDFIRYIGFDMDAAVGADPTGVASQGDGTFEAFGWVGPVHDSMMLRDITATNAYDGFPYAAAAFADVTTAFFGPAPAGFYPLETVARFKGENAPNSATSWYGGDLVGGATGGNGAALEYDPGTATGSNPPKPEGFTGSVTPGMPNLPRVATPPTGDTDGDGLNDLLEGALGSDPNNAAIAGPLPFSSVVVEAGVSYPGFTYQRLKGGAAGTGGVDYSTAAYNYTVETSTDLQTWTAAGAGMAPVSVTPNPDNVTETVVLRAVAPPASPPARVFTRLKVAAR